MTHKNHRWGAWILWIAALGWVGVLFLLSGQDGSQSGSLSMQATQWLLRLLPLDISADALHPILRKIAHFGFFAVEGLLLTLALNASMRCLRRAAAAAVPACGAMAVLNELHQSLTPGRSCEIRDMIIDTSGAALGVGCAALMLLAIRRLRRRNVNI